ncbi:MAG TPA: hypothetical protein VFN05_11735 [Actinomycetes bacterium]|nr:hypothetical protein [Actinomycetes bacterium]
MKKVLIGAAVVVAALAALRRFGPALEERAMRKCEQMFDRMPAEFPPKRGLRGIEQIREQNTQILRRLQEQEHRPTALAGV